MPKFPRVLFLLSVFALTTPAFAKKLVPVDSDPAPGSGLTINVRDDSGVLNRAHVWVETLDGKLLAEGETEAQGDGRFVANVPDAALASGVAVTAYAPGHSAVSFLENVAHRVTLELPADPVDSYSILHGKLTGFKENDDETKGTAGLVAKAFELSDLAGLDPSAFVSPLKDTIDVFGSRDIPSNIVLPDQTFPVYFIPVHVNKPEYRLPLLSGTSSRVFGIGGTVDVQGAIDAIRNNNGWGIVNLLDFQKVGITKPIATPKTGGQTIELDVTTDVAIRERITIKPGRNTSSGTDSRRLVVSMWEPQTGLFVPTDVKQVETDDLSLAAVEAKSAKVLDVMVGGGGDHFRGAWLNTQSTVAMPDAGLSADITVNSLDSSWTVNGGETAQLMIAHAENHKKTSIGSGLYVDRWVLVSPRKSQLHLPTVAWKSLRGQLGTISHVSVDLLQMHYGSYPFINGEASGNDLSVLEKVRKEIH